jgi:hypothetical protein
MKNIKYTAILLFLTLLACQVETPQLPEKLAISTENEIIPNRFSSKSFSPRLKLQKGNFKKNIDFSAYLQNSDNLTPPPFARENSVAAVEKGCSKIKKVINKYPTFGYDETATITYRAVNLIDYIDYEYSDDPSFNGRTKFTYSANGLTVTLTYTTTAGELSPYKDVVTLNSKGYAVSWLHDLSNFTYENPYTEKIEYNALGFPTKFTEIYEGKITLDQTVKYTKENNFEIITDAITGDIITYTYDLTKKQLLALTGTPFWEDFARFYGENFPNYLTGLVAKDKTGKITFTLNIERTFSADGYPKTITRKENGETVIIFDVQSLDCKNYTFSAPRTWK